MKYYGQRSSNFFLTLFRALPRRGFPTLMGIALSAAAAQTAPFAYITNFRDDTVSVIDTATNTVTAEGPVGAGPSAFGQFIVPASATEPVTNLCSTLGDDSKSSLLDQDIFRFAGAKGETVTLALEAISGSANKRATLLLTDDIHKEFFGRIASGALPNTIHATLPATGPYLVTVAEHPDWPRGSAFCGAYCVTLESSQEAWQTLEPTDWVEYLRD